MFGRHKRRQFGSSEWDDMITTALALVAQSTRQDKRELETDVARLVERSLETNDELLLQMTCGLAEAVHPGWYYRETTETTATRIAILVLAVAEYRKSLRRNPALLASLDRLATAQLDAMAEADQAGEAVIGFMPAVTRRLLGDDTNPIPLEGWYLVGGADARHWRYCDGDVWTNERTAPTRLRA